MKNQNVRYAFMYRRISSHNQVGNNSMDAQEEAIRKYAEDNNIKIVGSYQDIAITGTSVIHRAGYKKIRYSTARPTKTTNLSDNISSAAAVRVSKP